jgi:glycosyltransferase involved in cell wall biosynthesis
LTFGGAERWYRVLVERLVESGSIVTYLTRRQWEGNPPSWTGVDIVEVSADDGLYDSKGTRRTGPAVRFGVGTLIWMLRHRKDFDAIVVANFPFFSLLAARTALLGTGTPILVDYHEVWSPRYWRTYAGWVMGTMGAAVQKLVILATVYAQVFAEENARRLRLLKYRGDVAVLAGLVPDAATQGDWSLSVPDEPVVLYVGRHISHKGVSLLPKILLEARKAMPDLRMVIVGDGPERESITREMDQLGLSGSVTFMGSVSDQDRIRTVATASCSIVPSLREGYGIVVVESVAAGTPVVVADNPENLATSLVESGVNGIVVEPTIEALAEGIVTVIAAGEPLRRSAMEWGARHAKANSVNRSADQMVERIASLVDTRTRRGAGDDDCST